MALLLLLLAACDSPDDCSGDTVWSPIFGQCIGVEEASTTPSTDGTPTGDTGADTASGG